MDSSGFSSPRTDCFPAGLRVLVVDDDPTWLKILEKMLKKCNYEVTTCNLAREALNLLRERKDGFDIVISDVNMPDMDGFKLLEHVGLEMDLPVIMMSVDGETSRVMKGVQHGACDYLLKPIRMKELRNIWQHVFRKRIHEVRDIEGHESLEEIQMMRSGTEHSDDVYLFSGDLVSGKKRKDFDNNHDDRVHGDHSSVKKARVVWTVDLHQKFVKAVNQIGFEKVGPKKILDLMGVPWLTRENVASHLQKYRLYLSRLEKENELKSVLVGTKHTDFSLKDPAGNVSLQKSLTQNETAMQQNILANKSYAVSGHKIPVLDDEPKVFEGNLTGVLSKSRTESKKALFGEAVDPARSNTSRLRFNDSFESLDSDVKSEPKIQVQYSWSAQIPSHQFKQDQKPDFHSERRFDHLPLPAHHIQVNSVNASLTHNPGASRKESDKPTQATPMPSYDKNRSPCMEKIGEVDDFAALFSVQPESHLSDCHVDPNPCYMGNTKKLSLERDLYGDLESSQRNVLAGTGSTLKLWDEDFTDYSSQLDFYPPNAYLGNIEALGYTNPEIIADVTPHLFDSLNFNFDYLADPVEYPIIDQGLFIA